MLLSVLSVCPLYLDDLLRAGEFVGDKLKIESSYFAYNI